MPQSLVKNLIHLVFSTKHREPLIDEGIRAALFEYSGGVLRDLESHVVAAGAWFDHVHILFQLSRKHALSEVVMAVKRGTSAWIKTQGPRYDSFYWQNGYGAFSIGPSAVDSVSAYIASQSEHHQHEGFQDELRGFLHRYGIEFDERYLWD
jgi:REP element-mobilizing transposase RayT